MHRTYEAICESGHLEWLNERPDLRGRRVLVTVLEETPREKANRSAKEVRHVLAETRGAWGSKSADEIDREMDAMREEWNRPWYPDTDEA